VVSLLQDPRLPLESLVSHRLPFGRAPEAYRMLDEGPDEAVQVVFEYEGG
jgi:threonine dehydrogenase-like Zn-dependent dehydrogenase